MKLRAIATAGVVAALSFTPAEPVRADAGDAIAGAIIGGIIGNAIAKDQQKRRQQTARSTTRSTKSSGISSAQREANREVQTALNYFGYPVGAPDGAIGPKSRNAISQYQVLLGYPATGQLTEYERTVLVTSYHRAVAGGPLVAQTISTHPQGMRGLLLNQRDEMAGITPQTYVAAPAPAPAPLAPAAVVAPVLPLLAAEPAPAPAAEPALPSFLGNGATTVSLASHCNKISLMTNTNGGYTSAAAMTDASFALGEQFCLARTYAMASGEDLAGKVPGFTPAQIAEQCQAFGPVLKDHVAALSLKPRDEVLQGVQSFVMSSGMAPAQLAGTAKICLGVGYTTDAMDVAIGSALLLTVLGEKPYAELLGHHLSQGFGASARPDLSLQWYETGLEGVQATGNVFAPGLPDRAELIRKAAYTIGGRADLLPPPTLPVFAPAEATAPVQQQAAAPAQPAAPVAVAATPDALPVTGGQVVSMAARLPFLLIGQ